MAVILPLKLLEFLHPSDKPPPKAKDRLPTPAQLPLSLPGTGPWPAEGAMKALPPVQLVIRIGQRPRPQGASKMEGSWVGRKERQARRMGPSETPNTIPTEVTLNTARWDSRSAPGPGWGEAEVPARQAGAPLTVTITHIQDLGKEEHVRPSWPPLPEAQKPQKACGCIASFPEQTGS